MNNLMIFEDKQVEVFEFNGKILFNPYHCGNCLGISNEGVRKAITRMNENQVIKLTNSVVTDSHIRKLNNAGENFLTESGVYKLIFKSKKEEAEKFQDWVTDEVLPNIRKTGGYIHTTNDMSDDEIMARALQVAQKTIEKKSREIEEKDKVIQLQQPKVLFADAVSASNNSILVGELAKLIKQNGVDIGQNRLFAWMRENGYLIKRKGEDYNIPTQKSMNLRIMEVKKRVINNPDGSTKVTRTVKITGKGQVYFVNKFKSSKQLSMLS
ncbi:phage antirepressor KilAC domain-containing protein [Clostridioides difficile]|nr:phage antirepressor KilAC domain-containing protein [Clostridioides difficile]MDN9160028.1 phage antirepressor KilAC domain-containing protein [Clostridioides difficile]HBF5319125.1 phage antirepressor KilAC domain-containing protein [Clostridioides difficile]HBG2139951.1 phage antirepressor KilAC domain-containing protein [Clostridioides difficile]